MPMCGAAHTSLLETVPTSSVVFHLLDNTRERPHSTSRSAQQLVLSQPQRQATTNVNLCSKPLT